MSENNQRCVVLGAGLSALGFASEMRGCSIYEALPYSGGHAHSHEFEGAWFDRGAHICHARDPNWLKQIYTTAGRVNRVTKSCVQNVKQGVWFSYPVQNHLNELPERWRIKALQDFVEAQIAYRDQEPSNYYEWCLFQYGRHITEEYYRLYTSKYWHVPMEELATDWLGGRLLPTMVRNVIAGAIKPQDEEQAVFAAFHYPRRGGFHAFFKKEYARHRIHHNHRACRVSVKQKTVLFERGEMIGYDQLVSSIPLPDLIRMIDDVPGAIREAAGRLRCLSQVCINMLIAREPAQKAHWFYIYDAGMPVARVSFPMRLSGVGQLSVQAEAFFPQDAELDTENLGLRVSNELQRILDLDKESIMASEVKYYKHSYIVSDLERAALVKAIHKWLESQQIHLVGMFGRWEYMWSDRAYASGKAKGRELSSNRRVTSVL